MMLLIALCPGMGDSHSLEDGLQSDLELVICFPRE